MPVTSGCHVVFEFKLCFKYNASDGVPSIIKALKASPQDTQVFDDFLSLVLIFFTLYFVFVESVR